MKEGDDAQGSSQAEEEDGQYVCCLEISLFVGRPVIFLCLGIDMAEVLGIELQGFLGAICKVEDKLIFPTFRFESQPDNHRCLQKSFPLDPNRGCRIQLL